MRQKFALPLLLAICVLPAACTSNKTAPARVASVDRADVEFAHLGTPEGNVVEARSIAQLAITPAERFVAVEHKLEVASSDEKLEAAWDAVVRFCGTLACEVTASSITARSGQSPASGNIALRIAPQDFPKLLAQVEKQGNIVQHSTLSQDKTTQVVDTEARLKNLIAYRDSLRAMLSRPGLNIKDSVEIQEKLSDVQADLDGETRKRKILANETEKVAVEIEFRVKNAAKRRSAFAPLWAAAGEAGETLAESLGSVITFVVFVIPWILLLVLVAWLIRLLWRKRRARRAALGAAPEES